MKLLINAWTALGFEQTSTEWKFFTDATDGTELVVDVITNPDNMYVAEADVIIPVGQTVYVEVTRYLNVVDEDGNPVLDSDGNPVTTVYIGKRTPLTNMEGLKNSNIFEQPMPIKPIIDITIDEENKEYVFTASKMLPEHLILEDCYWSIMKEGEVLDSFITDGELKIPFAYFDTYRDCFITLIQKSVDGLITPTEQIFIMPRGRINVVSNLVDLTVTKDNLIQYEPVVETDLTLFQDLKQVLIYDEVSKRNVGTYDITFDGIIKIDVDTLLDGSNYFINFVFKNGTYETFPLNTLATQLPHYVNRESSMLYKYVNYITSNISKLGIYVEKTFDGRFLNLRDSEAEDGTTNTNWEWVISNNGIVQTSTQITSDVPFEGPYSTINTTKNRFVAFGKDKSTGLDTMYFCYDSFESSNVVVESTLEFPGGFGENGLRTATYTSKQHLYITMENNTTDGKLGYVDINNPTAVIEIPNRPDNEVVLNTFATLDSQPEFLLMLGGGENMYAYNVVTQNYSFINIYPEEFTQRPLQRMLSKNGDILYFDLSGNNSNSICVFDITSNTAKAIATEDSNLDTNFIKSNGVIIRHNASNALSYLL